MCVLLRVAVVSGLAMIPQKQRYHVAVSVHYPSAAIRMITDAWRGERIFVSAKSHITAPKDQA